MKKIAIFGKPGSGKSTLARRLSNESSIPLYPLDSIEYDDKGDKIPLHQYQQQHTRLLHQDSWLIDGFGPITSFYERLSVADTLIYIDLPYPVSYWLVTKRLLQSALKKPLGWPDNSSVFKGTLQSYKTLKLSPKFWNDAFSHKLLTQFSDKQVIIIKSTKELNQFSLN